MIRKLNFKKGLKLSSIFGILLLTTVSLSFKNTTSKISVKRSGKKVVTELNEVEEKSSKELFNEYALSVYNSTGLASSGLDFKVFFKAIAGYQNLKDLNLIPNTKAVLSVVDLTMPSTEKRMWVIDLTAQKLLFNTLVAHGRGSGEKMAEKFSNIPSSNQSSVGFFTTAEVYTGKHGRSLRLDGLDTNLNSKARERAIVVHGAEYVSQNVINATGRLGRSQGCPALPMDLFGDIINDIKNNTLMFINGEGVENSEYLKDNMQPFNGSEIFSGTASDAKAEKRG